MNKLQVINLLIIYFLVKVLKDINFSLRHEIN